MDQSMDGLFLVVWLPKEGDEQSSLLVHKSLINAIALVQDEYELHLERVVSAREITSPVEAAKVMKSLQGDIVALDFFRG